MKGQRILVTGATGFVGRALVAHLIAAGVEVAGLRLLVRDIGKARTLGLPADSLVAGDLGDSAAIARAAAGAGVAFHVAGAVRALSPREFLAINATGTAALVDGLREHAPGCRLIHVSSLAAAGPSLDGATSALPPEQCRPRSAYGESKRQAELNVTTRDGALAWTIVRPPVVYGAGDAATRLLFRQVRAPLVVVPWRPRPLSLIHVDDLARALIAAAVAPRSGLVLPLDGPDRLDTDALMRGLAAALGRRARLLRVPLPLVWPAALGADLTARLRGRATIFGRDKLREVGASGWVADPLPARAALGFESRIATAEGFRRTAREEGWI